MEFVEDRESKRPFSQQANLWQLLQRTAMSKGLMCYPGQGTADGQCGDHVILAPPYIITENECDELVDKLQLAIDETLLTL